MTAQPKRILFVDDRPEYMHQPVLRLRMEGYQVDEAESEEAAITALREHGYDLLVFDADLPGGDGWQVLKRMRQDEEVGDAKVIVLMAASGETANLHLVEVDAELRRPFTMAQLLVTVREVLES